MLGIASTEELQIIELHVEEHKRRFRIIEEELKILHNKILVCDQKSPPNPPEYAGRIADLEVKMAKLWALLVQQDIRNNDKLTRFGKSFGGKGGLS